ncbi:MAG TPA: BTAD domain-containing putative transcriptional regulator [Chloroflexota bacterium]
MANGELTLELFGTFRAAGHAPITGFRTDKARALLAYLAVEADRAHARANLATLLWPNMLDDVALRNLRKTLHRLNEMLAESLSPTSEAVFLTTRQSIQLNPDSCELDVATFGELLETSATHPHRHLHLCEPCLDRLTRAASLYRGELLAGFGIPDAEPFEEWLLLKRERFHHLALRVLHDLAAAHLEREEYDRAYTYATRQVELDPGREEAHRQVIRALARKGQRSEALTYARQARQMLLDTLGVEPAPETVALTEQLRQAETGAASAQVTNRSLYAEKTRLHNLPTQLTPFVGRQTELLWIAGQLRDPECRIVSILGPGGIGKTRLAVRAAENLAGRGRFPDGVTFIALAEVRTAQQLPALHWQPAWSSSWMSVAMPGHSFSTILPRKTACSCWIILSSSSERSTF